MRFRPIVLVPLLVLVASLGAAAPVTAGGRSGPSATDEAVAYQIDLAHDGLAIGSTLTPPLAERWPPLTIRALRWPWP